MKFKKTEIPIFDKITLEQAQADIEKTNALIDYISMMSDIEIPTDEGDVENIEEI